MAAAVAIDSFIPAEEQPKASKGETSSGFDAMTDEGMAEAVGHLSGNYHCTYVENNGTRSKGTLFAGSGGVAFVGWTFFFPKKLEILWTDVLQVVKTDRRQSFHTSSTYMGSGSYVSLIMRSGDVNQYDFSDIHNVERVWATLVSLQNEAQHGLPDKVPLLTPLRASLRRMSTDPTSEIPSHELLESNSNIVIGTEAAYVAAATAASMDDLRLSGRSAASSAVARRQSLMASSQTAIPIPEGGIDVTADLEEAWKELQKCSDKQSYATSAIQDLILPCSLDTFFDTFIADSAQYSIKLYMESVGEENVSVSPWTQQEDDAEIYARTIAYSHPVNAPLAPPMARARKDQRYRKYANHGLSIETDTYVEDVPMADCFYVTERTLVEPANQGDEVVILSEFDIRFVKSTMFRSIIANTTRSQYLAALTGFEIFWLEALATVEAGTSRTEEEQGRRPSISARASIVSSRRRSTLAGSAAIETVTIEVPTAAKAPSNAFSGMHAMIFGFGVVLVQLWMAYELKQLNSLVLELTEKIGVMHSAAETCSTA